MTARLRPWPAEKVTARMTFRLDDRDTVVTATCGRLDGSGRVPIWHTHGCIRVTPGTALAVWVDEDGLPVLAPELTAEQQLTRCQPVLPDQAERERGQVAADVLVLLRFLLGDDVPRAVEAAARLADWVGRETGASISGADMRREWPAVRTIHHAEIDGELPRDGFADRETAEAFAAAIRDRFPTRQVRLMRSNVLQLRWVPAEGGE